MTPLIIYLFFISIQILHEKANRLLIKRRTSPSCISHSSIPLEGIVLYVFFSGSFFRSSFVFPSHISEPVSGKSSALLWDPSLRIKKERACLVKFRSRTVTFSLLERNSFVRTLNSPWKSRWVACSDKLSSLHVHEILGLLRIGKERLRSRNYIDSGLLTGSTFTAVLEIKICASLFIQIVVSCFSERRIFERKRTWDNLSGTTRNTPHDV